jgi:hypothetical protein
MPVNSVLLSGCSFSDYCGWGLIGSKNDSRCWYNILAKEHDLDITNISYGGRSNREIIHLASEEILLNTSKYDTVILQLTSAARHWFFRETNPEEFCIINGDHISNTKTIEEKQALKLVQVEFSPISVELKKDLISLLMLQFYLHAHHIKLIMIDAMSAGSQLLANDQLGSQIDLTYSSGFNNSWINYQIDCADDHQHPGEKTNRVYADLIGKIINKIKNKGKILL